MSEMVERVALALEDKLESLPFSSGPVDDKQQYLALARVAIETMRDSCSGEMYNSGVAALMHGHNDNGHTMDAIWKAMIDAALK